MIRRIAKVIVMTAMMTGGSVALAQDQAGVAGDAEKGEQGAVPAAPLWLMSCSNQLQPEQLLCEISQSIVVRQGNQSQRLATASFSRVAGKPEMSASFIFPYGVSLPDPARIMIDDKQVATLKWQSCDAGGCYADAKMVPQWWKAMLDGNMMKADLKARDGRDITFSFQLVGFTKAQAMLP